MYVSMRGVREVWQNLKRCGAAFRTARRPYVGINVVCDMIACSIEMAVDSLPEFGVLDVLFLVVFMDDNLQRFIRDMLCQTFALRQSPTFLL
jgi:hypothetical protein